MRKRENHYLKTGVIMIVLFMIWTIMIQIIDVRIAGETHTKLGFATLNVWFHKLTGVHLSIYHITDWLGLVPVCICLMFGTIGFTQLIKRRNICKVETDILMLGIYYIIVIAGYLTFEMIPINYRPILINGIAEASYPSSTTLLVLSVMPTLSFQGSRRLNNKSAKLFLHILTAGFSAFMVIGRMISGVHWITDIVGSVLFSFGLFYMYLGMVDLIDRNKEK
jgi:undecaprenyl-diphosphatase